MSQKSSPASVEDIIKSVEKKLLTLERQRDNIAISIKEKRAEIEKLNQAVQVFRELDNSLS